MRFGAKQIETLVEPRTQCVICGTENLMESLQCLECSAPMALAHDSSSERTGQQIVSILGESNVGKTVYLGFLLDMLSQRAGDFEAIPVGPYSVDIQQNVISHLARRLFPPKTPMEADQWHWAYHRITPMYDDAPRQIELIMPDMAGESLAAEIASPDTFRVIRSLISKSNGLLLLLDAALAANGSSQPDFFGLKMLSYVDALHSPGRSQPVRIPIAIVLCKADYCPECFNDPAQFVQANLNRVWNLCDSRFANVQFYACTVVGSLGYATSGQDGEQVAPVPLHVAPRGVLEPFQWVIDQL